MRRRKFLGIGALSLVGVSSLHTLAGAQDAAWLGPCPPEERPEPKPKPKPWSPRISTAIHTVVSKSYMGFSQGDVERITRQKNVPLVIASGVSHAPGMAGWTVKHLYDEDILLWVKKGTEIMNISCADLQQRIQERDGVFFNMEEVKYLPVHNWMNHWGFGLPDLEELRRKKLGEQGYSKLLEMAAEHKDPLVVGVRGMRIEGFRPIAVGGFMPMVSNAYPLRKPVFGYYRDEEEARSFWKANIVEQQSHELEADRGIYEMLRVKPDGVHWK